MFSKCSHISHFNSDAEIWGGKCTFFSPCFAKKLYNFSSFQGPFISKKDNFLQPLAKQKHSNI